MQRSLLALVLGAVAGASTTYFFTIGGHVVPTRDAGAGGTVPAPAAEPRMRPADSAPSGTAERAALYREAADAGGTELARLISAAAAQPGSRARSDKLGVLLARYAELDAERAVATARELGMNVATLAALYAQWAAIDPAGALAALGDVESPAAAATIGLALLSVLGDDDYALRQVLAALPHAAENDLRIGALADLASSDPAAALERALALDDFGASSLAMESVGRAWARTDPRAALKAADAIDDNELRSTLQSNVLRAWAQMDSSGLLEYALALDPSTRRLDVMSGLLEVARLDPERLLEISERLPPQQREPVERIALTAIARRNPEAALERLRALPPGPQRDVARQGLARAYGNKDPDAALAWAQASGDRNALFGVLGGIAIKDPNRAFAAGAALPPQDRTRAVVQIVNSAASDRDADLAGLAERLLSAGDDAATANGMTQLLQTWQARAPERAMDWIMANAGRVPSAAFQTAGRYLAENDPAAAERRLAQVPSENRVAWLQGVAQSYARNDAKGGAAWVERLRGDPAYPSVAGTIAQGLARVDAPAAAALLDGITERGGPAARALSADASNVAASWARTDPVAAAEWARGVATDQLGAQPLASVAQIWADGDYAAARAWTLQMPAGTTRDAALRPLLMNGVNGGNVDTSLLGSFSSEVTRQQAVITAAGQLAGRSPKEARALVDRYVTRPELREQAERVLERAPGPGIGRPIGLPLR